MKKYFMFFLGLCLFTFACEQESIVPEWTDQNYELNDRARHCDLNQIPLYIPPVDAVGNDNIIDIATTFPVTASTNYESENERNITIQQISYKVNGSLVDSQFEYQANTVYNLSIEAISSIDNNDYAEEFSLAFRVNSNQKIEWRGNFCLHDGQENQESSDDIDFRTIQSIIVAD